MASRYNFSIERENRMTGLNETFQVIECNSWEEARAEVQKAVHDQELAEKRQFDDAEKEKELVRQKAVAETAAKAKAAAEAEADKSEENRPSSSFRT